MLARYPPDQTHSLIRLSFIEHAGPASHHHCSNFRRCRRNHRKPPRCTTRTSHMPEISLIVPAYNEAESIDQLYSEACAVLGAQFDSFEIIFIDDGSEDETPERIAALAERDGRVRHIELARNAGKSRAYSVGFAAARGRYIATADADLQDDLSELPKLRAKMREGFQLVVGRKSGRFKNEPLKAAPSYVFNFLILLLFGLRIHDSNSGFRLMTSAAAKSLKLHGGYYRFIPELVHLGGFKVTEVPVNHRKRQHGNSKFGPSRFWGGLLDLLSVRFVTAFMQRPLQFFGTLAMIPLLAGFGLEIYVLVQKLSGSSFQNHVAALLSGAVLLLAGLQIAVTGLIGEMLAAKAEHDEISYRELRGVPSEMSGPH